MFYTSSTTDTSSYSLLSMPTGSFLTNTSLVSSGTDTSPTDTALNSSDLFSPSSDGSMQTNIGGDALAVGDDTTASGEIDVQSISSGPLQLSAGMATFSAEAQSSGDDPVYADANTYAGASGADVVLAPTIVLSEDGEGYEAETSQTFLLAVNIDGYDLSGGALVIDPTLDSGSIDSGGGVLGDGNVAVFDADASAQGDYTLIDVQYDVLTVSNQLSTVSGVVVTEVA